MTISNRLWSAKVRNLTPYVPGEQPKQDNLCKLNTNENPFPPSPAVKTAIAKVLGEDSDVLRLYPEPESDTLRDEIVRYYGQFYPHLSRDHVFVGNGSDEVLALIFSCFFVKDRPILMPDISYSFYPVYAQAYSITTQSIPLKADFSMDTDDYRIPCGGIILANPNAPTGILLGLDKIRKLASEHPNSVIVIDEAYIDYADEPQSASAIALIAECDNVIVTQTFSKSRSLAGMRVGMAFACPSLIAGLTTLKNSFNSYPLDRVAQAAAMASIADGEYFEEKRLAVIHLRNKLERSLTGLGFEVLPSATNFLFAKPVHKSLSAKEIADKLREKGVIVRHFDTPRIKDYLRITVGTTEQHIRLIQCLQEIMWFS